MWKSNFFITLKFPDLKKKKIERSSTLRFTILNVITVPNTEVISKNILKA